MTVPTINLSLAAAVLRSSLSQRCSSSIVPFRRGLSSGRPNAILMQPWSAASSTDLRITSTVHIQAPRYFSSSRSELSKLLARELKDAEKENSKNKKNKHNMPMDLEELYQEVIVDSKWRLVDDDGIGLVRMHHPTNSGVTVSFHCQDTMGGPGEDEDYRDMDYDEDDDDEDDDDEDDHDEDNEDDSSEDDDELAQAVRFIVTYTKAGSTLVLTCLSEIGAPSIERISITKEENVTVIANKGISQDLYQGPVVEELPEDIQTKFLNFVENDCGVSFDVAAFIGMYADYKEEKEYKRWLKQARQLLGDK